MLVVGVLSGTSVDGIDVAVCRIREEEIDSENIHYKNELVAFETISFPSEDRSNILEIIEGRKVHIQEICKLNFRIGELFGKAILETLKKHNIGVRDIDLVGSHGQTMWHDISNEGGKSTLQLGDGDVIASLVQTDVVSDFRTADVAHGGQGAPLTSIQDFLMHKPKSEKWIAIQNIGGMGNVSFVNSSTRDIICFDTGPGNILSDLTIQTLTNGEKSYDKDGDLAKRGKVNEKILKRVLDHEYFSKPPPKTTGRELFSKSFVERLIKNCKEEENMTEADIMSTILQITVESMWIGYTKYGPSSQEKEAVNLSLLIEEIIINGGGAKNLELMRRIQERFSDVKVVRNEEEMDCKEAKLFALLAYLNHKNRVGNIPSVTGASKQVILGKLSKYYAQIK